MLTRMQNCERPADIGYHVAVGAVEGGRPGNDDIVEAALRLCRRQFANGRLEASPDAVAADGVTELFGNREAEPWTTGFARSWIDGRPLTSLNQT